MARAEREKSVSVISAVVAAPVRHGPQSPWMIGLGKQRCYDGLPFHEGPSDTSQTLLPLSPSRLGRGNLAAVTEEEDDFTYRPLVPLPLNGRRIHTRGTV